MLLDDEDGEVSDPDVGDHAAPVHVVDELQGHPNLFPYLGDAINETSTMLNPYLFQPILFILRSLGVTFVFTLQIWAIVVMACILFSVSKFDISWTATNQFVHIVQAVFVAFGAGDWFSKSWHYLLKRFNLEKLDISNLPFKVTCSKCNSVYDYHECYERDVVTGADGKERVTAIHVKNCMKIEYPLHPQREGRLPCNTPLLETKRRGRKGNLTLTLTHTHIHTNIRIYIYTYECLCIHNVPFYVIFLLLVDRFVAFAPQLSKGSVSWLVESASGNLGSQEYL
jgi:hypothetical protein